MYTLWNEIVIRYYTTKRVTQHFAKFSMHQATIPWPQLHKESRKLRRPSADIACGRPPDLWPFELQIDTPVAPAWETFTPISVFLRLSVFQLGARTRRTDRRTDEQDACCGLLWRPHNNAHKQTCGTQRINNDVEISDQRRRVCVVLTVRYETRRGSKHVATARPGHWPSSHRDQQHSTQFNVKNSRKGDVRGRRVALVLHGA